MADAADSFARPVYEAAEELLDEPVGEEINLREEGETLENALADADYSFLTLEDVVGLMVNQGCPVCGDVVLRSRTSYTPLCQRIIGEAFPEGIRWTDEEIGKLRSLVRERYPGLEMTSNDRSPVTKLSGNLVLRVRSTYVLFRYISIKPSTLETILEYIDSREENTLYYGELYAQFSALPAGTSNVDSAVFLHGVLAYSYPDRYHYGRDFLSRRTDRAPDTLAQRVEHLLTDAGTSLSRAELLKRLPGITPASLYHTVAGTDRLFPWETNRYNSSPRRTGTSFRTCWSPGRRGAGTSPSGPLRTALRRCPPDLP